MALFHVSASSGGPRLGCTRQGGVVLSLPGMPGIMPLVAQEAADGVDAWFVRPAIDEAHLVFEPGDEPQRMLLLHAVPAVAGMVRLLLPARGHALAADAAGIVSIVPVPSGTEASDATLFRLVPADPDGRIAASLSAPPGFDGRALRALLDASDPAMIQCARGLMQALGVEDVRTAWADAGEFGFHDRLFPIMLRRNTELLGVFGGYTRDLLRAEIDRFDWSIGHRSYGRPTVMEAGRGTLTIGRYCSLADPTVILGNHRITLATTYPFVDLWREWPGARAGLDDHRSADVVIGNDVWIGVGSIILPGAVIGDGVVVAAGSVVRGRIPPYVICGGNPAVVVRPRIDASLVGRMLALRWWDWPDEKVSRYIPLLLDRRVESFLEAAEADLAPA